MVQELNGLKASVEQFYGLTERFSDLEVLWQLGMDEKDESVYPEVLEALNKANKDVEQLELTLMLSGEYDGNNAILTLHAGAGGTEASRTGPRCCLGCMCAAESGYKVETMDFLAGEKPE